MANDGLLIILSGPSGCGKGTIVSRILKEREDTILSVSVTTRAPRPGEIDGFHYRFITAEEFDNMVQRNDLLEYAQYSGNCYGTPRTAVEEHIKAGRNVILEIDVQGALQVMQRCDDYVSVFLTVPSMEELEKRLRGRGTEEESRVQARLTAAKEELEYVDRYQYRVLNDDLDEAVEQIHRIIETEKSRKNPQ
ncbi:MAG: guanylate kinase [Clostridia bacterium]|nr:guanylate kinase [Clostridia bacterium]